jgi:AsmA protein
MSKTMRRVLVTLAGSFLLVIILAAWLGPRILGANVKSRLEAHASDALRMQVSVDGPVALRFFPGLHVTVADVHIRNRTLDIASIGEVQLSIEWRSLLDQDLKFDGVRFKGARITVTRDASGKYNVDRPPSPTAQSAAAAIGAVSLAASSLVYADALRGNDFRAEDCTVELPDLKRAASTTSDILKSVSFRGRLSCAHMRTNNLAASKVEATVAASDGTFKFDPVALEMSGGHGTGTVTADFTGAEPIYHVRAVIAKLQVADFSKNVTPKKIAEGALDFTANLSMHGTPQSGVMGTVAGEASLRGNNLVLDIGDLDKEFTHYESTQNFNLIDMGAFFLAGPLGVAVTKGYDYARVLKKSEGHTTIRTLISQWKLERGIAMAQDVALATPENRIAMQGGLDFASDTYDDVTIALIDAQGCTRVDQKIRGSFRKPDVQKPNVVTAVTGPAHRLLIKSKRLFGAKCVVFYSGAVQPPK